MATEIYQPENLVNACGGSCIVWDGPILKSMPCASMFDADDFKVWLPAVNEMAFEDFGSRFPGCCCFVRITVCSPSDCACHCGCKNRGVDLNPVIGYPALNVVGYFFEGVWQDQEAIDEKWEIHQERFLVPKDHVFPAGYSNESSVVIKYGRRPPSLALRARDEELMRIMAINCHPKSGSCTIDENVVTLSENGRVQNFDLERQTTLYQRARARWELGPQKHSMVDPADYQGLSRTLVQSIALGDWPGTPGDDCVTSDIQVDQLFADIAEAEQGQEDQNDDVELDPITGLPI